MRPAFQRTQDILLRWRNRLGVSYTDVAKTLPRLLKVEYDRALLDKTHICRAKTFLRIIALLLLSLQKGLEQTGAMSHRDVSAGFYSTLGSKIDEVISHTDWQIRQDERILFYGAAVELFALCKAGIKLVGFDFNKGFDLLVADIIQQSKIEFDDTFDVELLEKARLK